MPPSFNFEIPQVVGLLAGSDLEGSIGGKALSGRRIAWLPQKEAGKIRLGHERD